MPVCCFCSAHVDSVDEAAGQDWVSSFFHGTTEYAGPVCCDCACYYLTYDKEVGYDLADGFSLPGLAIRLQRHPNKTDREAQE